MADSILTRAEVEQSKLRSDIHPIFARTITQAVELLEAMLCDADCECPTCKKTIAFLDRYHAGEKETGK